MRRSDDAILRAVRAFLVGGNLNLPDGASVIWEMFVALHHTRGGGMGPAPITFAEIEAYARLMRWPLEPHHVTLVRAIDRAWMEQANKQDGGSAPNSGASAGRAQPVNPAAFDAVFG